MTATTTIIRRILSTFCGMASGFCAAEAFRSGYSAQDRVVLVAMTVGLLIAIFQFRPYSSSSQP